MISLTTRSSKRAASAKVLKRRVAYLEDRHHESHKDKTIFAAHNHNCPGSHRDDFIQSCLRNDAAYQKERAGKVGKRSKTLFNEIIYSSDLGAHLTDAERDSIELLVINEFARNTPCRVAWHTTPSTGRADLHILAAAKDYDCPPRVSLWRSFGGKKGRHLYHTMDLVDEKIAKELNKTRVKEKKVRSARRVHRDRIRELTGKLKRDLANELAPLGLAMAELKQGIEKLGYKVVKETAKNISVLFNGNKRPNRYNKADLFRRIAEAPDPSKKKGKNDPDPEPEI